MKQTGLLLIIAMGLLGSFLSGQNPNEVTTEKISDTLAVVSGVGGNIAVLKGDMKLLLIDAGVAGAAERTQGTIAELFPLPVEILINTHYHQDHTGGNKRLADGKIVVAHQHCVDSMKTMAGEAAKSEAGRALLETILIPDRSYETERVIEFGDETVRLLHFGPGHSRGDTVVIFKKNRVIHTGDLLFHDIAPYIDVKDGSDTANWIKTLNRLAREYPDYKVIPGHGALTDSAALLDFARYLQYLRDTVQKGMEAGKTIEEITAATAFTEFERVKAINRFMTPQNNLLWVYQEMTRPADA